MHGSERLGEEPLRAGIIYEFSVQDHWLPDNGEMHDAFPEPAFGVAGSLVHQFSLVARDDVYQAYEIEGMFPMNGEKSLVLVT